jgi:hypothetical protein
MLRILDEAGHDNIGLAVDFWHLWNTGTEPDDVAKIDGSSFAVWTSAMGLGHRAPFREPIRLVLAPVPFH